MGEYEPEDSRTVTQSPHRAPGEPPRTGPREDEARKRARHEETEEKDKPTARNVTGEKEKGFANHDDEGKMKPDESSVPLGN
jgi:hypothetical protein